MWTEFFVFVLVMVVFEKGYGADVEFKCPKTFLDGQVNSLTLEVNHTAVAKADCFAQPQQVLFLRRRTSAHPDASASVVCSTNYSCNPLPVEEPSEKQAKCSCVLQTQDTWTYEIKLYANEIEDAAANFSYQVCVLPSHPLSVSAEDACTQISFDGDDGGYSSTDGGDSSSTDGGYSSSADGGYSSSTDGGDSSSTDGGDSSTDGGDSSTTVVLIVVGVILCLVVAAIAVIFFIKRRNRDGHIPGQTESDGM